MKNVKMLLVFSGVFFVTLFACNKMNSSSNQNAVSKEDIKQRNSIEEVSGFKFPDGTIFTNNLNSDGEIKSIDFKLPVNSKIFGILSNNTLVNRTGDGGGGLKCTCTGTGGCKPFTAGGKWGCLIDGCSKCTGTVSSKSNAAGQGDLLDLFFIQRGEGNEFLALSALNNSRPIIDINEWLELPFVTNEEINRAEFQNAIISLLDYIDNKSSEKQDMVSIPFYISGKKMLIDVPYSTIEDGMLYTVSGGSVSCSGSCPNGSCGKSTAAMGQVTYCDGCQSGCTLTMTK
jgi:hypothetical protein